MAFVKCRRCGTRGKLGNGVRRVFVEGRLRTLCKDCLQHYHDLSKQRIRRDKVIGD